MNAHTFLDNFGTIADAPGGVDRLRELIRGLAVRGQLEPQDPVDGVAKALLDQAAFAKEQLIRTGEVPKSRALLADDSSVGDAVFKVPPTWIWTRLDDVAVYIQRGKGPTYVENSGVPVVSQKCIQDSGFDLSKARFVDEATLANYGPERFLREGDLLWNSTGTGTVGRVNVFPGSDAYDRVVADSHVTVVRTAVCSPRYLHCWLSSSEVRSTIEDRTTGTTKQQELNTSTVRRQPVPLPPRAEQDRIVAKVDELMQLCDELEARQETRHHVTTRLRASSLAALTKAKTDDDLRTAWYRIHTKWEHLTDHPDSVGTLRSSILDLATRGLLVEQDPLEEPAEALVRRIGERREQLGLDRAGKAKDLAPIGKGEVPNALPVGWEYERLGNVVEVVRGLTFPASAKQTTPGEGLVACLRTANVQDDVEWDDLIYVCASYVKHDRQFIRKRDILMSTANSRALVGKVALNKSDATNVAFGGFVTVIRPIEILPEYLMAVIRHPSTKERLIDSATQTTNIANISMGRLRPLVIALPPLAEQERIVAKLDSLMHLCDVLQSSQQFREKVQRNVAESLCSLSA